MLSRRILSGALALALPILGTAEQATAQFYSGGCSGCGTAMPVAQTAMAAECMPVQPVVATCYQTVPVTTYAREKQTVEVPYYKTEYEEREVTVMRPVTRQREVEVPTVSYQNVTEMRTMTRDMGRWQTNYQPVQKCSPCQVDPRPGMIGWLNRTGYSFRSAMTPSYTTSRQYVPNMVTCNVPVTRQVAVQGTRRVTVSETEMVAERKTEKVAVQRLAYRKEDVTVMRAQTAYRTVPIGTSMAYGGGYSTQSAYYPYGAGSAMAFGYPIIESSPSRTAQGPVPDDIGGGRSADRTKPFPADDDAPRSSSDSFKRNDSTPATGASFRGDDDSEADKEETFLPNSQTRRIRDSRVTPAKDEREDTTVAGSKSGSGWRATRSSADRQLSRSRLSGSRINTPRLSLAEVDPAK